ncbi:MAG: nickel-dependent lactate racemase, partial [Anaerolineae bacterium]|nr:nickel-dependent lactate racemase [Anaerolineae bacterium]
PIGGPPLRELARGARKVLIVADDGTRLTPTERILPVLLEELNAVGISDEAITLLIALGTHRAMTPSEIEQKFGREVVGRVQVLNHNAFEPSLLVDLGTTPGGVHVQVHRLAPEADLVIGVGSIVPHHIPGFSGGAKIIQPGICGEQTTGEVHLLSVRHPFSLLGRQENQVRQEMEAIAEQAGLRMIVNVVLDRQGRVAGVFVGEPRAAFRQGVSLSRRIYGVEVPGQADIVVASSHPCDSEFWQAHKTLYPAELCVRPGGTIIVVTPCPEGVSATHPEVLEFASWPKAEIDAAIRAGKMDDLVAGALTLAWAGTREKAEVFLVSGGISPEEARALGFRPFPSVQDALGAAFARHGPDARVMVLPYAPDILPLLP